MEFHFTFEELPDFLREEITNLETARMTKPLELCDCEESQLLAAINAGEISKEISSGLARELRSKYLSRSRWREEHKNDV